MDFNLKIKYKVMRIFIATKILRQHSSIYNKLCYNTIDMYKKYYTDNKPYFAEPAINFRVWGKIKTFCVPHKTDLGRMASDQRSSHTASRDVHAAWENEITQVGAIVICDGRTIDEQIVADDERQKINKEIARLEKLARAEKQEKRSWVGAGD
jgi:hypothetical protein